jgi:hypothetical protein
MSLENRRKYWKEGVKKKIWTVYHGCPTFSIKSGVIGHGAFFE